MLKTRAYLFILFSSLLLSSLILSGCGGDREEPTPTPTKTLALAQDAAPAPVVATATPVPLTGNTGGDGAESNNNDSSESDAPAPASSTVSVAIITAVQLNIRSEPTTNGEIVRRVDEGQQFDVIEQSGDGQWVRLAENGQSLGWASAEFLNIQNIQIGGDTADTAETVTEVAEPTAPTTETAADQPAPAVGNFLPATMSSPDYGGQAFLWWREEIADRDLKLMDEAGFNWVKQAFAWETIEGAGKGQFDWSIADRVVQQINGRNLKLLARVSTDPDLTKFWAGHPPQNADNFADFVFALASRYNCQPGAIGCIQAYQVWNEPNLAREWGNNRPNPAQYAEFLGKAYAAIKRANPNAVVISAGMAPTGDNSDLAMPDDIFYEQMYQAMGSSNGYFDMLGVHGAGFAAPPELDPADAVTNSQYGGYRFFAFRHVEDIRNIMVRYGDEGKKIVLLEFGWTYDSVNPNYKWHGADAGIDAFKHGEYLERAYEWAEGNWRPWIGLMSLLTMPNIDWLNDGNPNDEEQYWWAILEPSGIDELKLRPAYVILCIHFNGVKGQICPYDPN